MPDEVVNIILEKLERLEEKIDNISYHGCAKQEMHSDQESRIRSLEADRNKATGIIALITLMAGSLGAVIIKVVHAVAGEK